MSKNLTFTGIFAIMFICVVSLVGGCAKPPAQEITKAERAVDEAGQKEAPIYVPEIFKIAEDLLKNAKDLVADKRYKEAKNAAEEATRIAGQAIVMIESAKEKMKAEAELTMDSTCKELEEFKVAAAKAVEKKTLAATEEVRQTIGKAEIDLVNIREKLQEGQVKQAYDDLAEMRGQLAEQKKDMEGEVGR